MMELKEQSSQLIVQQDKIEAIKTDLIAYRRPWEVDNNTFFSKVYSFFANLFRKTDRQGISYNLLNSLKNYSQLNATTLLRQLKSDYSELKLGISGRSRLLTIIARTEEVVKDVKITELEMGISDREAKISELEMGIFDREAKIQRLQARLSQVREAANTTIASDDEEISVENMAESRSQP